LAVLVIYFLIKKDDFDALDKKVFLNIMNFSISFAIYFAVSIMLVFVIIGIALVPLVS